MSLKPLSKLQCIGRNKTECAWQQVQSHALLRQGFGTSEKSMPISFTDAVCQLLKYYTVRSPTYRKSIRTHSNLLARYNGKFYGNNRFP